MFRNLAFALLACLVLSRPAFADLDQAQAQIDRASKLYTQGDYEGALQALRSAETLAERAEDPALPSIRFNIARCLEKLERWEEALKAYQAYDELPDASHRKQRAFRAVQRLEAQVFANLSIACDPSGSTVVIEGVTEGTPSCPWSSPRVPPGSYAVKVSHPGYIAATEFIEVQAGEPFTLQVSLERDPDAPTSAVTAGGAPRPSVNLLPWGVALGALTAGGVALATGIAATNQSDDAEALPPGPERDDLVSAFETNRALSYTFIAVGGALAVTSAVLFIVDGQNKKKKKATQARLTVGGPGLQVTF